MNKRIAAFCFSLLVVLIAFYSGSCKRIHEATDLGDGLIPAVDNVTTFDTIISVNSYNDSFTIGNADKLVNDSTRMGKSTIHYIGHIDNDPLFGKSDAQLFMELKPSTFKYYFENKSDSLALDSVVLVLDYKETFGDTNALQTVNVFELKDISSNLFKADSSYLLRIKSFQEDNSLLLGTKTFAPSILNDSIKAYKDTTKNQLRIRLSNAFGNRLLQYDSSSTGAYAGDSAFRSKFKGFAVIANQTGNALMGFGLASSKLALYYRYTKNLNEDTTVRYFTFNTGSGNANYVTRNYNGFPIAAALSGGTSVPDDLIYLQNTPGTFARIRMPDLLTISNRVVHRAELIVEQVYHPSDEIFFKPEQLFLDVLDTTLKNYRYMPYDFVFDAGGSPNMVGFGTTGRQTLDAGGNPIHIWKFNMSRYVQNVLTRKDPLFEMRLLAPYILIDVYKPTPNLNGVFNAVGVNSAVARGRVRVAGGNYSDPTRRMRLRIVYSKI